MDASQYLVPADSEVIVRTGGGGGWGNPLERDPESVRHDVIEGLVSAGKAQGDYSVVLDPTSLAVDSAATERLRASVLSNGKVDV
jgi:N-methylhydantoinase B